MQGKENRGKREMWNNCMIEVKDILGYYLNACFPECYLHVNYKDKLTNR